ncbi:MAG: class IV adenylate cyclase [Candidatus Staskawiczbacteria bacterium]|nr:class IV adenylate cyclase [Candidatus Staskawiczbacteria bacterium]
MENVEIEIQVKIENAKVLADFLNKNAQFKYEDHQVDEYFSPAHCDFTAERPIKEWLRLRDSNGKYSITYKNWYYEDGRSTHCDEYESSIDDIGQVRKIMEVLNFKNITTVDKIRKSWDYKDYEVSMDSIKGLGDFVEVEYKGDKKDVKPKKVLAEMTQFLKDAGCGKIERNYVGYPFQFLFPSEVKFEEQ